MFDQDARTIQRIAPLLQRVLILDPDPAGATAIGEMMRRIGRPEVTVEASNAKALKACGRTDPQVIVVELSGEAVDGVAFTQALRRSDLACRKAPVILVTGEATAGAILAARDAGVHEFLRRPFTVRDLVRRLDAAILRPRTWVEAVAYVGPDRRRFNSGDYKGPLKRHADIEAVEDFARIGQALKILRSAIGAIDQDPAQALRAMRAQASELQTAAGAIADTRLETAAGALQRYLSESAGAGERLHAAELERRAAPLLAQAPRYMDDRVAA